MARFPEQVNATRLRKAAAAIREYLSSGNMEIPDDLEENADIYAKGCRYVNDRLADCERLHGIGQRSEAIRQAELPPDLLTLCGEIDRELNAQHRARWEETALQ